MNNPNRTSNQITVKYDGEDHVYHEMDIFELAQALQGFGEMIQSANDLMNDTPIEMKVDAKFKEGSFGFLIDIIQYGTDILPYIGYGAVGTAISGATLLEVVQKLRGSKIEYIEPSGNDGHFNVSVRGEKIEINDTVRKLVYSKEIRRAIKKVIVDPLSNAGTSSVEVSGTQIETVKITKEESNSFRSPKNDLQISTPDLEVTESNVRFITAHSFKATGWGVELLGQSITVTIADELFMEKISNMEEPYVLNKNFIVKLEIKTKQDPIKGMLKSYRILKVLHPAT